MLKKSFLLSNISPACLIIPKITLRRKIFIVALLKNIKMHITLGEGRP
jgi:hypothetical protein